MTEPDINVENWSTQRLATYLNDTAPVAAELPDDAKASDQIKTNVDAAMTEFQTRNAGGDDDDIATDGGEPTIDAIVDDRVGSDRDHYLRHVTDKYDDTFKTRHKRSIRTTVEDGVIVHQITESYDRDAPVESLRFKGRTSCPEHGSTERDISGDDNIVRHRCTEDGCPFEAAVARRTEDDRDVGPTDHEAPVWYRATIPVAGLDTDFDDPDDWESKVDEIDDGDDDDIATFANIVRHLSLRRHVAAVKDKAYVPSEFDDDGNKVEDEYIDTFECGRCGDEWETTTAKEHTHFGTVCPECEGATVWSVDDADIPDDVRDRMDEHKSFGVGNIVALLRDVIYWPNFVAEVQDRSGKSMFVDDKDVDPEDVPPIKTGKQGKVGMGGGGGYPGTGLRRPNGFAHNFTHWRTALRDAVETGLVEQVGDRDIDDEKARWKPTDKGREVFDELSRCPTCGSAKYPMLRISTYKVGRRTKKDRSLTTACPSCESMSEGPEGAMVIEDSQGTETKVELPGVDYNDA